MADLKKLISLENLTSYDTLIKKYVDDADAVVDAKSIKKVVVNGDNIEFYKSTAEGATPDFTVPISSSDVENIKKVLKGYTEEGSVATAVADAKKAGTDAQAAVETLDESLKAVAKSGNASDVTIADEAGKITATTVEGALAEIVGKADDNATAIAAINNSETGLLKQAKDYTDALANGQVKTNKEAIEAINDTTTGIEAVAKKYTDDEIDKVEATIGTVTEGETVVSMIADAKKAGTDANAALETYKTTNDAAVKAAQDAADAAQDDVDALELVVGDMTTVKTTSKEVAGAIDELYDALEDAEEAGEVTLTTAETATAGYLKTYVISQGGEEVGKIDIPKDLVVKSGEVVVDPDEDHKGTFIKLVIANDEETPIYIDVKNLVDIYKGAEGATQVQISVDGYTISASLVAGGVGTTELADAAVTTAKIADENVTKAKLSSTVQASLDKADAAEKNIKDAIEALDSTKSQTAGADGLALEIVEEDGKITSISGSIAANTYDAYGAAKTVQDDLDTYKYEVASVADINKLFSDEEE